MATQQVVTPEILPPAPKMQPQSVREQPQPHPPAPAKIVRRRAALQPANLTPMDLLSIALTNNAAMDVIERLIALQNAERSKQAEIEFNQAMSACQAEIVRVTPDLQNPQTRSKYASYAALDKVVRPAYTRHDLSLSFNTADPPSPDSVRVLCYCSKGLYTRIYQVDMPSDGKGARGGDVMTKTHAAAAAMSYGMRYLLKYIFNVAIGEEDIDGNQPSNGEIARQLERIAAAKNIDELKALYFEGLKIAADNKTAQLAISQAKDARKRELQ